MRIALLDRPLSRDHPHVHPPRGAGASADSGSTCSASRSGGPRRQNSVAGRPRGVAHDRSAAAAAARPAGSAHVRAALRAPRAYLATLAGALRCPRPVRAARARRDVVPRGGHAVGRMPTGAASATSTLSSTAPPQWSRCWRSSSPTPVAAAQSRGRGATACMARRSSTTSTASGWTSGRERELHRLHQRLHPQPGDGVRSRRAVGQTRGRALRR